MSRGRFREEVLSNGLIRFLHLSDFHVGKDKWAQQRLFDKILKYVGILKDAGVPPDLVFLTGDIANHGMTYLRNRGHVKNPYAAILNSCCSNSSGEQ
jgi:3',5'-cyclic AMP phosphodiesterase CpdA